jgi:hypothetical protein
VILSVELSDWNCSLFLLPIAAEIALTLCQHLCQHLCEGVQEMQRDTRTNARRVTQAHTIVYLQKNKKAGSLKAGSLARALSLELCLSVIKLIKLRRRRRRRLQLSMRWLYVGIQSPNSAATVPVKAGAV